MSTALYDKALLEKLCAWTRDTQVHVTSVNETKRLFQLTIDNNNDKPIELPLIALSRHGGFELLSTSKRPLTFDGMMLDSSKEQAISLNGIPINIEYQLDIYTRYQEEADEFVRNIVYNIINYPKLQITIPYRGRNYLHDANIRLTPQIEDNSDIPERLINGQFIRTSISIYIDDAYLWDINMRDNYSIEYNVNFNEEI